MALPTLTRFKTCTKCGCTKPATRQFFYASKHGRLGLKPACKVREGLRQLAYYQRPEVAERYSGHYRRRYWEKREFFLAHARRQRSTAEYKETKRRSEKKRYDAMMASEQALLVERQRKRVMEAARDPAQKRASGGTHTFNEVSQMYEDQGGLCAYCETPLLGNFHVDHMTPLCRGGANDWSNLAVACPTCNRSKHAKTALEFVTSS